MFRDLIPQFADAHGAADATAVSPDGYSLDNFYLARLGADEVQLDLFGDSKTNIALYPAFQQYFRTHKPPLLAVWGRNDPFFLRRAPRRSSATILLRPCASSTPAISRSRPMRSRSRRASAISWFAEGAGEGVGLPGEEEDFRHDFIEDKTAMLPIASPPARDDARAGVADAARRTRAAHALRHEHRPRAGRGSP